MAKTLNGFARQRFNDKAYRLRGQRAKRQTLRKCPPEREMVNPRDLNTKKTRRSEPYDFALNLVIEASFLSHPRQLLFLRGFMAAFARFHASSSLTPGTSRQSL
ncbi:hypothetical protein [Pseudescherichia sp.]|uniref:hypothetical protein n=1 Tax=Pseudescherichia sp. TaxID=2055881 RepID=UPI00289B35B7|nr:hypothetical protein [Pseudescherichia sp.]